MDNHPSGKRIVREGGLITLYVSIFGSPFVPVELKHVVGDCFKDEMRCVPCEKCGQAFIDAIEKKQKEHPEKWSFYKRDGTAGGSEEHFYAIEE